MDIHQIRHANFVSLFKKFVAENSPDGRERGMIRPFADKLGLTDRFIAAVKRGPGEKDENGTYRNGKPIGSRLARSIEKALGINEGYMDVPHDQVVSAASSDARFYMKTMMILFDNAPDDLKSEIYDKIVASGRPNKSPATKQSEGAGTCKT